jgi:hypothetical protein
MQQVVTSFIRHERSEFLINECLEMFINELRVHTILFLPLNKQNK